MSTVTSPTHDPAAQAAAMNTFLERYRASKDVCVEVLHKCGQALIEAHETHGVTQKEIAARIKRARSRVNQMIAAMRQFPALPTSAEDRELFESMFNGHTICEGGQHKPRGKVGKADHMAALRAAIDRCVKRGATKAECQAALDTAYPAPAIAAAA